MHAPFRPLEQASKHSLKESVRTWELPPGKVSSPQPMRYCTPQESITVCPSLPGQEALDTGFVETGAAEDVVDTPAVVVPRLKTVDVVLE